MTPNWNSPRNWLKLPLSSVALAKEEDWNPNRNWLKLPQ